MDTEITKMSRPDPISSAGHSEVLNALIDGKKLEDMTVGIAEIDPAPTSVAETAL